MKKGFTLIELLVVIAIIGVLATIVIVSIAGAKAKSLDSKALSDLASVTKTVSQCGSSEQGTVLLYDGEAPVGAVCQNNPDITDEWPVFSLSKGSSGSPWEYIASASISYNLADGTFAFEADSDSNAIICDSTGCSKNF